MNELKIIENELVPVYETSTGEKVVNGTLYVAFAGEEGSQISWALYDDIKPYIQNGG